MTSIHASIPENLRDPTLAAKMRGEKAGRAVPRDIQCTSSTNAKVPSSSSLIKKKTPRHVKRVQSLYVPQPLTVKEECSASEGDEESGSKENNPMLAPPPVSTHSRRRLSMAKRPLSDLFTTSTDDCESCRVTSSSPPDQDIQSNAILMAPKREPDGSLRLPQLADEGPVTGFASRGPEEGGENGSVLLLPDGIINEDGIRPTKRICLNQQIENNACEERWSKSLTERSLPITQVVSKVAPFAPRKASAPRCVGVGSVREKARVGLRRL